MTCHSFYCFSIVWGQGNAPLVTFLPNSCYICSEVVEGVRESLGILRQRGDLLAVCYHPRGGSTPLYGLYGDVPLDRVWFSSSLS